MPGRLRGGGFETNQAEFNEVSDDENEDEIEELDEEMEEVRAESDGECDVERVVRGDSERMSEVLVPVESMWRWMGWDTVGESQIAAAVLGLWVILLERVLGEERRREWGA